MAVAFKLIVTILLGVSAFLQVGQCLQTRSTALIIAVDDDSGNATSYMLNGYGVMFDTLKTGQQTATLPALNDTNGIGSYGLIVVYQQAQYQDPKNLTVSALSADSWNALYDYQRNYGVRMIHLGAVPNVGDFGAQLINGGCCISPLDQNITLDGDIQAKEFPLAGLKTPQLSTEYLWHYPSKIVNTSNVEEFLSLSPNANFPDNSTGGVINRFDDGREQMAFFIASSNSTETSAYLSHIWVQWGYRGLIPGHRRLNLNTQVDDLLLQTALYYPDGQDFRLRAEDLDDHLAWQIDLNTRLNPGSNYFTEFGFNSNGNLIWAYGEVQNSTILTCTNPVFTGWSEPVDNLEYKKPLGTGVNYWPDNPSLQTTSQCLYLDPIVTWLSNITQRDAFGLVSHTFTHLELNNATYHDATREIAYNLMYAEMLNLTLAEKFSASGLIPPAITGLHNGDVLRAWSDNGLWNCVGDNTRPVLRNPNNFMWPQLSDIPVNGYNNFHYTPRFATRIFYNCDLTPCNVKQWIDTTEQPQNATIYDLLSLERSSVTSQLVSLYHDPYMFHQPNIRSADVDEHMINGQMQKLGLLQMWVETIVDEVQSLVNWPLISLKHDDIAFSFNRRMVRDGCDPFILYTSNTSHITDFEVHAGANNTCVAPIPVQVPTNVTDTQGQVTEQVGSDPMTIWVRLNGDPISFTLDPAVAF